jgi:UDP-GlcNAc:undecaprenyl-phosphate/decaprenyl-phosphate GlcNAc-1-phosphate transferase
LLRLSIKIGSNRNNEHVVRWASTTKPLIGGLSFYITFLLAALVYFITQRPTDALIDGSMVMLGMITLGFLVGLHDDAYNTRPLLKFSGQLGCAFILIAADMHIQLFHFWPLDYLLTIFWVVGIMNSVNLLDNMDGVTGTVSLTIILATILRMAVFPGGMEANPMLFVLIATVGALVGFLILNWHPSKIYMGDTGSQFLGALLAFAGVRFLWNFQVGTPLEPDWTVRLIVPVMIFIVPIMDTTFVTFARILRGQSPFVGGKDHLTHNMTYIGIAEKHVPIVLGIVSIGSSTLAVFGLRYLQTGTLFQTGIFTLFIVIVFVTFGLIFRRGARIGRAKQRFGKTFMRAFRTRQGEPPTSKTPQHS